jgi:hypothetical protein
VLGAAWRCLLPDARARAELLARDGVDTLALVLEAGNKHVRSVDCLDTAGENLHT